MESAISGMNGFEMLKKAGVVIPLLCHDIIIRIDCTGTTTIDYECFLGGDTFQSVSDKIAEGRLLMK